MKKSGWTFSKAVFVILLTLSAGRFFSSADQKREAEDKKEEAVPTETVSVPAAEPAVRADEKDPYSLSFESSSLFSDADLRAALSHSRLEYCSSIEKKEDGSLLISWNRKSDGKGVYSCSYSFDKKRSYGKRSVVSCKMEEAFEDFDTGRDTALIRDYVMPEKDDGIDMFVYEKRKDYYERYFILGKYSDMDCYIEGDDIFFEYSWYRDSEEGPVLVYRSTAKGTETTSGQRYHEESWDLFEESYKNIDIIPYEDYPREKDPYEVYRKWKDKQRGNREEEQLKEDVAVYCDCADEDELYSEYTEDFDSYEDAMDFFEEYCK
ncbi:MAG: hypothetical protein K5648_09330 [Erysipelotrichaceae bacterium]|nr:hypothetical protein [Erysipelotrichaceae bacterium]